MTDRARTETVVGLIWFAALIVLVGLLVFYIGRSRGAW